VTRFIEIHNLYTLQCL